MALRARGRGSTNAALDRKEIKMQKKARQTKSTGRKNGRAAATAKRSSARSVAKNLGAARPGSKLEQIVTLLRRPSGATTCTPPSSAPGSATFPGSVEIASPQGVRLASVGAGFTVGATLLQWEF